VQDDRVVRIFTPLFVLIPVLYAWGERIALVSAFLNDEGKQPGTSRRDSMCAWDSSHGAAVGVRQISPVLI
jgi:hypothetical protein